VSSIRCGKQKQSLSRKRSKLGARFLFWKVGRPGKNGTNIRKSREPGSAKQSAFGGSGTGHSRPPLAKKSTPIWARADIWFDGTETISAKPIREALADRAAALGSEEKPKGTPFVDDGKQETLTVAQIASLWRYSTDTVQRLFADEPGVQVIGSKNPRGKRSRTTLRIPRDVMNRVKKRLSNR
jgi:hypothetical protein